MSEKQRVSVSTDVTASPESVYAMVTDLPRMGEWSPENQGGSWQGGATAAAPGVKFKGKNSNGKRSWGTGTVVLEATAPSRFVFRTVVGGLKVSDWIYEITPTAGGCRVTETWIDTRPPGLPMVGKLVTGVADRATFNRAGMESTLANLKKAAEAG